MIFVITGTEAYPFNRLIKKVDMLKINNVINDDIFIQLGSTTYLPKHCSWQKWLSFGSMKETILKADLIISHAGAGATLLCLELGKTPLLITRRKEYGEHLDNHQVPFARMMEKLNYAIVAYDISDLEQCIKKCHEKQANSHSVNRNNSELISYIGSWLES